MSVRHKLRLATASAHEALHRAGPFAAIENGTIGFDAYGKLLGFLHRYHGSLSQVCRSAALALDRPELAAAHQDRVTALTADLAFLGRTAAAIPPDTVPGDGFAIGCLYTVQGSTLGGKVLHRQLAALLPGDDGRSFFKGSAADGEHWRHLCAGLEAHGEDYAQIEAGARHAFARFAGMLAQDDR